MQVNVDSKFKTIPDYCCTSDFLGKENYKNILETVFENGKLIRDMTFEQVRQNANKN